MLAFSQSLLSSVSELFLKEYGLLATGGRLFYGLRINDATHVTATLVLLDS